ncbi:MAG: heme lyase CcmF/NrfE family subunit [Chloroflexi bacterium]|nr:heme lyase CcmF/NrfE family subunit [Chloroflexota bacterium]
MADFGHIAIVAAFVVALYAAVVAPLSVRLKMPELGASAQHAVYGVAVLMIVASATLLTAFLTNDFSIRYVAEHSSREMPLSLVAAAFYGGQAGSLLYWGTTLSIFSAVVAWQHRRTDRAFMAFVHMTLMVVAAYFGLILGFVANPFEKMPVTPPNGAGLNPLLYDLGMLYHPPMLLAGYMSWTVPFAFAVAALATGRLDSWWIQTTRRYALVAWAVLGIGNMLGGWWAYRVLGWGGYWGWDPVENSAIMPWLIGTAFIHSVMIQERRGMLKVWNMALVLVTFYLAIFGTFVVRSGVITSVHSFAQSAIGPYFLSFLVLVIASTLGLLFYRLPQLRSDNQLDSMLSREASFLLNNLLFLGLVFAIFWGTIFPLVSEAVQGVKITVGPPFFNQVAGPIMIGLLVLMGIGPLMPWRKGNQASLVRLFGPSVAFGVLVGLVVGIWKGFDQPKALCAFAACGFVTGTIVSEVVRGTLARRQATGEGHLTALGNLITRNNRRYGGYVVHLGVVMIAVAVTASSMYQLEAMARLKPGEAMSIGEYRLTYNGMRERQEPGVRIIEAQMAVEDSGQLAGAIVTDKRFFRGFERQPSTSVGIRTTAVDDLYVVLAGWETDTTASFMVFVNPMVIWIWLGGIVAVAGTLVAGWPQATPRVVTANVPGRGLAVGRA